MAEYPVIFASRADQMLLRHTEFLSRVSVPAARQFYREFHAVIQRIAENPLRFPLEEDLNLPENQYGKALFAKRYKTLFLFDGHTVYPDAVVDCRMDGKRSMGY